MSQFDHVLSFLPYDRNLINSKVTYLPVGLFDNNIALQTL